MSSDKKEIPVQYIATVKKLARFPNLVLEIPETIMTEFKINKGDSAKVSIIKNRGKLTIQYVFDK